MMSSNITHSGAVLASLMLIASGCGGAGSADSDLSGASAPEPMALDLTAEPETAEETAAAEVAPPVFDFDSAERPINEESRAEMSDLEILNQILMDYQEARMSISPPAKAYKSEAEEMAALEAWEARLQSMAPVKDLSELVKAGVIKAVPTPPPGQKYVIDPQTRTVVLVNAP